MKVDKISRLFSALNPSASNPQVNQQVSQAPEVQSEAVKLSPTFNRVASNDSGEDSSRRARVEQLKKDVAAGNYKPRSEDVAEALARDLFY